MWTINEHFLDSGSFTLWTKSKEVSDYWNSDEFWQYMRDYVAFVRKYKAGIDVYANVDVIPDPVLSWRNLKWLEKEGLRPLPVIHYKTDVSWIEEHIKSGYEYIGFGGLVGSLIGKGGNPRPWLDRAFTVICDQPSRLPRIKVHGFGLTNYELLSRYPWYSTDSTAWKKRGGYGIIIVPQHRRGKFVFDLPSYDMFMSADSPYESRAKRHYNNLSTKEQGIVLLWLKEIDMTLEQVRDNYWCRDYANLCYFRRVIDSLPEWPWAYEASQRKFLV